MYIILKPVVWMRYMLVQAEKQYIALATNIARNSYLNVTYMAS